MQIHLQSHGFRTDRRARPARAGGACTFAFDRFADPVETMIVRLAPGEHGGRTSRCRLQVKLPRAAGGPRRWRLGDDLYAASNRSGCGSRGGSRGAQCRAWTRGLGARAGHAVGARGHAMRKGSGDGLEDVR